MSHHSSGSFGSGGNGFSGDSNQSRRSAGSFGPSALYGPSAHYGPHNPFGPATGGARSFPVWPNTMGRERVYWQTTAASGAAGAVAGGAPVAAAGGRRTTSCCSFSRVVYIGIALYCLYLLFSYRSQSLELGVKEQRLISANSWLVKDVKVSLENGVSGLPTYLYSFSQTPHLRTFQKWTENYSPLIVRKYGYESWKFWLNPGSSVKFWYNIPPRTTLKLVIVKGAENMKAWKNDPNAFNSYESQITVSGGGSYYFSAYSDGDYHFALGNFNNYDIQLATVSMDVFSRLYDLSEADTSCRVDLSDSCEMELDFWGGKKALIATPFNSETEFLWSVRVSYSPRWQTYFWLIGLVWFTTVLVQRSLQKRQNGIQVSQDPTPSSVADAPDSAPLLSPSPSPSIPPSKPSLLRHIPLVNKLPFLRQNPSTSNTENREREGGREGEGEGEGVGGGEREREENVAPFPESWVSYEDREVSRSVQTNYSVQRYENAAGVLEEREREGEGEGEGGVVPSAPPWGVTGSVYDGVVVKGAEGEKRKGGGKGEEREREGEVCAICMDAKKDSILVDCGHRATCFSCGNMLMEATPPACPICRKVILQVIKVYDA